MQRRNSGCFDQAGKLIDTLQHLEMAGRWSKIGAIKGFIRSNQSPVRIIGNLAEWKIKKMFIALKLLQRLVHRGLRKGAEPEDVCRPAPHLQGSRKGTERIGKTLLILPGEPNDKASIRSDP